MIKWLKSQMPTRRRWVQLYTALLYNAHVKGFIKGDIYTDNSKMLCVPGLNCYSCPGAVGACPLGALQNAVASSGHRLPFYIIGILLLYGMIFGRTICGYLCPFGLLQELLHKLPTPKLRKNRFTAGMSYLKYVILAVFVLIIPLRYAFQSLPLPAFCKYLCPAGTLEGAVGLLSNPVNADKFSMLGGLFTSKFLILLLIVGVCIFVYRAFCRFLCPLGAIYGLFSKYAFIGVKVDVPSCIDCTRCVSKCEMDIRHVSDRECIHCGECIDVCPTGAIAFKAGRYTLKGHAIEKTGSKQTLLRSARMCFIAWAAALILLASAYVLFNPPTEDIADIPQNEIGYEAGMNAPDFSAPIYGKDERFLLSQYRGQTVVLNFWATWCTPCCNELPYFDEVYRQYGDDVVVVAVHSNLVTDNVEGYLNKFDYVMPFALDETGGIITSYGGSTMLPHTVIIDERGVITYNAVGSLTYEELCTLIGK